VLAADPGQPSGFGEAEPAVQGGRRQCSASGGISSNVETLVVT
jgi:hypothetical protein